MYSYFTHPQNVCMSYFEHCKFSLYLARKFAFGTFAAIVHAFFPGRFLTHSSDMVRELSNVLLRAGCMSSDKNGEELFERI